MNDSMGGAVFPIDWPINQPSRRRFQKSSASPFQKTCRAFGLSSRSRRRNTMPYARVGAMPQPDAQGGQPQQQPQHHSRHAHGGGGHSRSSRKKGITMEVSKQRRLVRVFQGLLFVVGGVAPCFVALLRSVAPCCFVSFVPAPSVLLFSATRWEDTSRFAWKMSSPPNHECSHALPFSFGVLVGKCSLRPCMLYTPLSIYGS